MANQRFFQDNADPTKLVDFDVALVTTGTTRSIVMPDGDVRLIAHGATLPTSAASIGELFVLDGVGLHKALDLVGNWLEYTNGGGGPGAASTIAIDGAAIPNLTATDVRAAFAEHQGDIDTLTTGAASTAASIATINSNISTLQSIQGQYVGSRTTLAALNSVTHQNGDWAILSADDGANQAGLYVGNGTTFSLAFEIPGVTPNTDLTVTPAPTQITVNSSTGTDAVLPLAGGVNAGLLPPGVIAGSGVALPATANRVGELFWLDGVGGGVFKALDLVGNWAELGVVAAATLVNDSVTNAILDNMAANSIKANATTAAADPTDVAVAAGTILGRTDSGNLAAMTPAQARLVLRRAKNALTFNVAQAWDLNNGLYQTLGVTNNFTLGFPANAAEGETAFLYVTQDGVGGRTITFNSAFKFPGGTAPTLSATNGAVDRLEFFFHSATQATVTITKDIK